LLRTDDVNQADVLEAIERARPDALVVIALGQKLAPALLNGRFAINLHASLLPKYRGAAPINWAMINGETETGLSVITLAQRMDAGDVLARCTTPIDPAETAGELHERLALLGPALVCQVLQAHQAGTLAAEPQDETGVTSAPKLSKTDGTVRFDLPAEAVRCRIHGLTPWPGCTVTLAGQSLRLCRVDVVDGAAGTEPGGLASDGTVTCGTGAIRLIEVQPPGGRVMPFQDFARGHPIQSGERMQTP
jgi:methionyl-tRNA formyltransferase